MSRTIRHLATHCCTVNCWLTMGSALCLFVATVFLLFCLTISGPLHASCKVEWTWNKSCTIVNKAIVDQIHAWEGDTGCAKGGEKCLYSLVSQTDKQISAKHETPKKHYVDDLTFTFSTSGDKCMVNGKSSSETWYAILDSGTNYCNLHNLITGAGLDLQDGYKETTSDSICTQYSSANCTVY